MSLFRLYFRPDLLTKEHFFALFFCPFFFKAKYQLAHVHGNNNQGASRDVLTHLFAFSPPLAPQVGLIGWINGARANWTKLINI